MKFKVSIRPEPERAFLEGGGELADITIVMGRHGKSLFLRYLFALLTDDLQLALYASDAVLGPGGTAALEVEGVGRLECSRSEEDGKMGCVVDARRREAYLFYEGWIFTARYGREIPLPKVADAMDSLLRKVAEMPGRRYNLLFSAEDRTWYELIGKKEIPFALASSAVVTVGVLERAFRLNAWLLLDGTLDDLFPEEVFFLAGLASSAEARLVVTTHSPWVRRSFRCHRGVAKAQGMPAGDREVAAYEFVDGGVLEIKLASETYGRSFGRLYVVCE